MLFRFSMTASFTVFLLAASFNNVVAEELLLEDYQHGGCFEPSDWANSFEDSEGNRNAAEDQGEYAVVHWATKWSGMPSNGTVHDFSRFKTFQVDVMVEKGQPVEDGANFYFQLINQSDVGYSYWEAFVPQSKVPADGKWYRVQFPLTMMDEGHGDGGDPPKDFSTVTGTVCGMTFDDEPDQFKMKRANFDNLTLNDKKVSEVSAKQVRE